jgi:psiF repeat-containing protein
MRYMLATFAIALGLLLFAGDGGMAQTGSPAPMSKRALRQQDSQECTAQAKQQNIARRNLAEFVRKCMADRQAERKKQSADERSMKRGMAIEEGAAILDVRNRERREQLEKETAKRADCNKQANEQKLRVAQRRSFLKKCVAQ